MVPSYIESPRPGPTSPQMIWRPRCIMKPVIEPASPSTRIVPPFWSMPVRAPTWPFTTRSPPRSAGQGAGVRLDHDHAGHHVLGDRPAHAPVDLELGSIAQAATEVAQAALE